MRFVGSVPGIHGGKVHFGFQKNVPVIPRRLLSSTDVQMPEFFLLERSRVADRQADVRSSLPAIDLQEVLAGLLLGALGAPLDALDPNNIPENQCARAARFLFHFVTGYSNLSDYDVLNPARS
jgi:hypothetical protein